MVEIINEDVGRVAAPEAVTDDRSAAAAQEDQSQAKILQTLEKVEQRESEIELEERRKMLILMHSRGLSQKEMAKVLGISQPTVSRELKAIIKRTRRVLFEFLDKEGLFEYHRWKAGYDEIIKLTWDIATGADTSPRERLKALDMLYMFNRSRLTDINSLYEIRHHLKEERRKTKPKSEVLQYREEAADYSADSS
jgi:transcriptional regulator with XRE-family HTH domain